MKRYIYIIIGIVVVAVIAVGVIMLLKQNQQGGGSSLFGFGSGGSLPQTGTQGASGGPGSSSTASGGAGPSTSGGGSSSASSSSASASVVLGGNAPAATFGIISDGPILDYFVNASNTVTAVEPDGTIISVAGGTTSVLSTSTIPDIISASFSFDGKKLLVNSGDLSAPKTQIFDVPSKSWLTLSQVMQSPQWSPMDYRIAYIAESAAGKATLSTIDASNPKKAPVSYISLSATDLTLQWPAKAQFVLSDRPSAQAAGSVWMYDATKGTIIPVTYEQDGAESIWGASASGTTGLLFSGHGTNYSLALVTPSGAVTHTLSFGTLPSKCAFAQSKTGTSTPAYYLYCGIPANTASLSSIQLPDDYNMMSVMTSDEITRIDLSDGTESIIRNDATPHVDAVDIKEFNNILFFVSRYDQKLYAITLGQ